MSTSPGRMVLPSIRRAPIHDADDEAGDVVFAVGVEAGHLGGLAAEQRAAVLAAAAGDARDDLFGDVGRQPPGRQVVEEEQRPRALHQDVVDAVVHEIGADRVVAAGHECDFELRADAVRARDEHRLAKAGGIEREQSAERTDLGQHAGRERRARQGFDASDGFVAGVDVDAGLAIIH